jgi:hypothetical protein
MRINFSWRSYSVTALSVNNSLKDVGLIRSKLQCNSSGRNIAWNTDPAQLYSFTFLCTCQCCTTCSCSSPGGGGISLLGYARAVICRCATDAMFSPLPQNTHIAVARMTAPSPPYVAPDIAVIPLCNSCMVYTYCITGHRITKKDISLAKHEYRALRESVEL